MAQSIPFFRYRHEQLDMAEQIMRAMVDQCHLLAEAGTGVGKTYAYLLPALLWAANHDDKPVVISTRTRALQEQICDRDLPLLCEQLKTPLSCEEAKGRDNYLCWHKYERIRAGKVALSKDEQAFVTAILTWAESTKSGDRKELRIGSDLLQHWPIVAADRLSCLQSKCPQREQCFRLKLGQRLKKARIIICNHALLLSDLAHNIIPEYDCLIIDEAHAFSREAFDRLSFCFSLGDARETLRQLYFQEGFKQGGALYTLGQQQPELLPEIDAIRALMSDFELYAISFFQHWHDHAGPQNPSAYAYVLTGETGAEDKSWQRAVAVYDEWQPVIGLLAERLEQLTHEVKDEELPLAGLAGCFMEYSDALYYIMMEQLGRDDCVSWLDYRAEQVDSISSTTIYSGEALREQLIAKVNSAIMVSATLTADNSFDDFINRCGLKEYQEQERLMTVCHQSPFEYERLAALFCVEDMPDPSDNSPAAEAILHRALEDICLVTGGRTLILFTARRQLTAASRYLRERLRREDMELLVQHEDGEFGALMGEFRQRKGRILLGLETYWEGIDVKGEQLTCVVIVRLPFRPPTDPYAVAWDKYYRLQGQHPFYKFMVPDAALRFKQGAGRLIRSEEDHGAVIVLDPRIISKPYGKRILNGLPIVNQFRIKRDQLRESLGPWV